MKEKSSAFSILIAIISERVHTEGNESELETILNFMRITNLSIGDLEKFNKATEKNDALIQEVRDSVKETEGNFW